MSVDMHCPRCADAPLLQDQRCVQCHGALLDSGYAEDLANNVGRSSDIFADLHHAHGVGSFACPACSAPMSTFDFRSERVDWCPACGGLWLDAAEEARIRGAQMERSLLPVSAAVSTVDAQQVAAHLKTIARGSTLVLTEDAVVAPMSVALGRIPGKGLTTGAIAMGWFAPLVMPTAFLAMLKFFEISVAGYWVGVVGATVLWPIVLFVMAQQKAIDGKQPVWILTRRGLKSPRGEFVSAEGSGTLALSTLPASGVVNLDLNMDNGDTVRVLSSENHEVVVQARALFSLWLEQKTTMTIIHRG